MSSRRRVLTLVAGACALALTVTSAGFGAKARTEASPIKIGTIMSITGALASVGIQQKNAMELAVKQVNAAGGINGRKIEWKVYDPALDTAQAVSLTRRLVDSDRVNLVVGGGASSGIALAMQQILTPRGLFFSSPEADPRITDPVSQNPTTFQMTVRSTTVVQRLLEYAKAKGVRRVSIMGDTGVYGQSGVEAAREIGPKLGLTIKTGSFSPTATDLTPQLRELAEVNPGAIIIWTAIPAGVVAIRNAHDMGLDKKAMIMTSHSYANVQYMRQGGEASKGVYVPVVNATVYRQVLKTLKGQQRTKLAVFAKTYKDRYNQDIAIFSAQSYDAMNVALYALRLTGGNTDGRRMAAALEKAGAYVGVMGVHRWSKNSHYGYNTSTLKIARWSGSGWILQKG